MMTIIELMAELEDARVQFGDNAEIYITDLDSNCDKRYINNIYVEDGHVEIQID